MDTIDSITIIAAAWGLLVLRLTLAFILWPHGTQKVLGWFGGAGWEGTYRAFTEKMGIPPFLAKVAMLTEFFAPICLVLGVFTRIAALSVIILMAFSHNQTRQKRLLFQLVRQKSRGRRRIPPALCGLRFRPVPDRPRPLVCGRLVHEHRACHLRLTAADSTRKGIEHTFRFSNPPYSGIYGKAFFCLVNPFRHDQP